MYNVAKEEGIYHGKNPLSEIEFPSLNNTNRLRYLTQDEADKLMDKLKTASQTIHDMAYLGLYTGLRADEIFSLRWQDIDLEGKTIHILETKNTEARTAYITNGIRQIFEEKKRGRPYEFIFPQEIRRGKENRKKGNIKKNQVSRTFRKTVNSMKLNEGITDRRYKACFHTLRHTFGSWLAIKGESLYTIKELMGHRRISQTMRYAHLCPDQKRQAVEGLHDRD